MPALQGYSVPATLTDDAGNTLKGITVTVTGPSAYSGTAVSNATTGLVRLGPLPIGDYTVTYQGRSVTVPVVASAADEQTTYDLAVAAETPAGATAKASAAVATHAALPDPHTGYLKESDATATYVSALGIYQPEKFGAAGDGVADDTAEIVACMASAALTGGNVVFGPNDYKITSTLSRPAGVSLRGAGIGLTKLLFSGSGYAVDHPALDAEAGVTVEGFTISCSGASASGFRQGDFAAALAAGYYTKLSIKDIYVVGPGAGTAGLTGMLLSQIAASNVENVTVQNFETGFVADRTTANNYSRVTVQGCHYGALWTGQGTPAAGGQDNTFGFEVLGPNAGCPADAYSLKVDVPQLTMNSPYYEMGPGAVAKTLVWLTANANAYRDVAGRWQPTAGTTNTLLVDADASAAAFIGTWLAANGGAAPVSSIAAPGTLGGYNGNHVFIGCDTRLTDTLTAAQVAAGYVQIIGQGYVNRAGRPILQIPAIAGAALAIPAHIYSDPDDAVLAASATINDTVAGKVSNMAGAGAAPPTPVVVAGSNDRRGRITHGSGAAPSGNQAIRVNFSVPYNSVPHVVLTPVQGSSALVQPALSSVAVDNFIVNAPMAASQPNTAYAFTYMVEA